MNKAGEGTAKQCCALQALSGFRFLCLATVPPSPKYPKQIPDLIIINASERFNANMGLLAKACRSTLISTLKYRITAGISGYLKRQCLTRLFKCAILILLSFCSVRPLYAHPGTTINLAGIKPAEFARK